MNLRALAIAALCAASFSFASPPVAFADKCDPSKTLSYFKAYYESSTNGPSWTAKIYEGDDAKLIAEANPVVVGPTTGAGTSVGATGILIVEGPKDSPDAGKAVIGFFKDGCWIGGMYKTKEEIAKILGDLETAKKAKEAQ